MEAGGEINRDEVPLAYQQYVQQYFVEFASCRRRANAGYEAVRDARSEEQRSAVQFAVSGGIIFRTPGIYAGDP